jgi:gluconolactonase
MNGRRALGLLACVAFGGVACSSSGGGQGATGEQSDSAAAADHDAATAWDASSGAVAYDAAVVADASSGGPLVFTAIGPATLVSNQFYFTEGPVWDASKGVLYFTDINAHQGGTVGGAIYRLTPPAAIDVLLQPDGNADGLALDRQGHVVAAGFVSRSVWRLSAASTMQALAPCEGGAGTCYGSSEINTPDDLTVRSDGTIYFTDPTFGSGAQGFATQTLPLSGEQGVYRLTTDGTLHLEDHSTSAPNGVNLSPDEKSLYVSYTIAGTVAKFDVAADGSLSNKTTFATGAQAADSMCVDSAGDVYVGTTGGLAVFDPTGKKLGTISIGGLIVTNCAFAGADWRTLYVTARTQATLFGAPPMGGGALYRIDGMPVAGIPDQN